VEASTLQAPTSLPHAKIAVATPLLRIRSDEQLVELFRAGYDEAFRAIHERYHKRLFAYARQMLPARQDAEDALQDVFVRAYSGLRASDRQLALRPWLFRVAHNRCVDELRRPAPPPPEVLALVRCTSHDPLAEVDLRESLRRLIEDIRRLPDQQRSALLMRELGGMSYADLADSLGISVPAVKSLLVRARVSLAQAADARDTSCVLIREQLIDAHDRGMRPNANTRKHVRDCVGCKSFRRELRGVTRQLAATAPAIGPLGLLLKLLGISGRAGGSAAGGAGAGGGAVILTGGGATASAGGLALGVNHVATLIVAAVATAGGAVEIQHTIIARTPQPAHVRTAARQRHHNSLPPLQPVGSASTGESGELQGIARAVVATVSSTPSLTTSAAGSTSTALKPKLRRDHSAGGGAVGPTKSASSLTASSTKTTTTTSAVHGTSGVGAGSGSTTVGDGTCSTAAPAADPTTGSASPTVATSPAGSTATGSSPATTSCASATTTSGSTTSSPGATPSESESGTGQSTSGGTSTGSSAPASGSATGGTSSTSGSSATAK
jgi:RNA polymerase sigma factor (sigma-70 family)